MKFKKAESNTHTHIHRQLFSYKFKFQSRINRERTTWRAKKKRNKWEKKITNREYKVKRSRKFDWVRT